MNECDWSIRVYYEDTDAGGVVYHSNYLKYLERGRTEWLRTKGFEQDQLIEQEKLIFAVRRLSINYDKPARFNDELVVKSSIQEIRPIRIYFQQHITKSNSIICTAQVEIAAIHSKTFKPTRIPDRILQEIYDVN